MAPQAPPLLSSTNNEHIESTCQAFGLTTQELHDLKRHAVAAKDTAYCPYSKFHVGAALLTKAGAYIPGANVENAAYPVGTCAERVAFGRAVTDGHRDFKAVAVATDISPPASPCGMCRQLWVMTLPPQYVVVVTVGWRCDDDTVSGSSATCRCPFWCSIRMVITAHYGWKRYIPLYICSLQNPKLLTDISFSCFPCHLVQKIWVAPRTVPTRLTKNPSPWTTAVTSSRMTYFEAVESHHRKIGLHLILLCLTFEQSPGYKESVPWLLSALRIEFWNPKMTCSLSFILIHLAERGS